MGVAEHLHDLNFSKNLLEVLFIQLRLVDDLYSNLAGRQTGCLFIQLLGLGQYSYYQGLQEPKAQAGAPVVSAINNTDFCPNELTVLEQSSRQRRATLLQYKPRAT